MLDYVAFSVQEEFFKVPLELSSFEFGLISQPLVGMVLVLSLHVNLLHHVEVNWVLLHKVENPCSIFGLLSTELIAWESQNLEALALEIFVHLGQLNVVPLSDTSLGSDVDDEYSLGSPDEISDPSNLGTIKLGA